eukprot:TRINITY_DN9178_c0_g3_i1.p1 TRINITY_DN9178_c0_g3~~TRINITY_DN9178_c0_g3_i1.p1  ORF type:complete len:547 (-),score=123.00 TRINITY_DN9178_c0_g3_i1:20-1660(-)
MPSKGRGIAKDLSSSITSDHLQGEQQAQEAWETSGHYGQMSWRHWIILASHQFQNLICDLLPKLDLVIMEFASNDLHDTQALTSKNGSEIGGQESSQKYIEFLVKHLTAYNVSSLFLQASFRSYDSAYANAEAIHLPVQLYYDVPTVSFTRVFKQDYLTNMGDAESRFYSPRMFRDTHSHFTGIGHVMLAYTLLWNIQNDVYTHYWMQSPNIVLPHKNFALDPFSLALLKTNTSRGYRFDGDNKTLASFGDVSCTEHWQILAESRSKYGLISKTPGSYCVFYFDDLKDVFALEIGFMKSYKGMGKFRVTFLGLESGDDSSHHFNLQKDTFRMDSNRARDESRTAWRSYILDGYWSDESSQHYFESVLVPKNSNRFVIEVLPNSPEFRTELEPALEARGTKVKLLTIGIRSDAQSCKPGSPMRFEGTPDEKLYYYGTGDGILRNNGDGQEFVIALPPATQVYSTLNAELAIQVAGMLIIALAILISFAVFLVRMFPAQGPVSAAASAPTAVAPDGSTQVIMSPSEMTRPAKSQSSAVRRANARTVPV